MLPQPYLHRRRWFAPLSLVVLFSSLSLTAPMEAQAETAGGICKQRCAPKEQVPPFVEVDANTGAVLNGATSFSEGDKVQVIISRMNPYKYDYESQIKSAPLDISIVSSFLGLIPGADALSSLFGGQLTKLDKNNNSVMANGRSVALIANQCPPDQLQTLIERSNQLKTDYEQAAATAKALESPYKAYEKFVLATDKDFLGSTSECEAICVQGSDLLPVLSNLTDLAGFKDQLTKLQKDADTLGKDIASYKQANPACSAPEITAIENNVKAATAAGKDAQTRVAELDKAKPAIELLGQRITKTLTDNDSFSVVHYPYTQGEPTGVQITLFRKNLREDGAKEKQVGQVQLTVGQSRFSLSAGIGFSTIQDVTIVKQGDKFAEENKSDLRPSLTTMLNAQLHKGYWPRSTWGISTGLVLTTRDNTTEVEYIVGPNLGLLDNRFFIVLGYHAARVQSLRSKDIPADSQEIPVVKVWKSGAMLAFTYKIR
jgi:hypothetical protein